MNPRLESRLIHTAPYMFQYKNTNPVYPFKLFGFECNDGWFNLLQDLIRELCIEDKNNELCVTQVKEKFGTIRFYINGGTDKIYEIIDKHEKKSETICEGCGKVGTLKTNKWWRVTCDECETLYLSR